MVFRTISRENGCAYCVPAHTSALRSIGSKNAEIVELMAVVDGFSKMLDGLQVAAAIGTARRH